MSVFTRRNLKLFFRDKSTVFFSLLAIFIIVALYAVFLGGVWLPNEMADIPGADFLMNSWLVAGLLAVASVTTTMGAFSIVVEDKTKRIDKDFYTSPMKRSAIAGGYLTSAFLIGVILSLVTVLVGEAYIVLRGGKWLGVSALFETAALILATALANTSMVCFITSFLKSQSAFGTINTIIGTLIGFLTGIYLPSGSLPESVQTVIKSFPPSYAASLFRKILMDVPLAETFKGAPAETMREFKEYMGITFFWGGYEVTPLVSILILLGTAAIFYGLSVWRMSKRNREF